MSWLGAIAIIILILWAIGDDGDISDYSDQELTDELDNR